jgi:ferrous iron transport protein B
MNCHTTTPTEIKAQPTAAKIALVGHPNVGKSALFQKLTGQRVIISNYPGTTVEIARGAWRDLPGITIIDTPGIITFPPHSDDERVTARLLFDEPLQAILQVGDAKNLRRTLLFTVQLAEMGLPLVLALNMMDEAHARGLSIDLQQLAQRLGTPVIPTTAVRGEGLPALSAALQQATTPSFWLEYPAPVESAIQELCNCLQQASLTGLPVASRAMALLWLSNDLVVADWLRAHLDPQTFAGLQARRQQLETLSSEPLTVLIQRARLEMIEQLVMQIARDPGMLQQTLSARLSRLTTHPVWGVFVLAVVLYVLYWFVGVFGAGTLVGLLEENLFGEIINPWVSGWVTAIMPAPWMADLLIGEYGLWSMGITYALALILPTVSTFFLAFSIMEDSGYLPRLAALSNRMFRALGLNGKAVLPMVLGLGCVTMAALTTRVLESKRERLLVTLLLALAVPCSAQLGIVMGMLASISLSATLIWSGVVFGVLLAVGWLAAHLMPGERTSLLVELPPLRWPLFSNVFLKTIARLEWYLKEVVPLFLLGALGMFLLDQSGVLQSLIRAGEPVVTGWLGLPAAASAAFLMGFLRRDFGATGLFVMQSQGLLSPLQVVVAMVTITLFVPCIASVMVIAKERGWRTAAGMTIIIIPLAIAIGGLLNRVLALAGWGS